MLHNFTDIYSTVRCENWGLNLFFSNYIIILYTYIHDKMFLFPISVKTVFNPLAPEFSFKF
jgi:hypothetical protein